MNREMRRVIGILGTVTPLMFLGLLTLWTTNDASGESRSSNPATSAVTQQGQSKTPQDLLQEVINQRHRYEEWYDNVKYGRHVLLPTKGDPKHYVGVDMQVFVDTVEKMINDRGKADPQIRDKVKFATYARLAALELLDRLAATQAEALRYLDSQINQLEKEEQTLRKLIRMADVPQAAAANPDTKLLDDYYNKVVPEFPKTLTYSEPVGAPKRTKWVRSNVELEALQAHLRSQYQQEWHSYWCNKGIKMGCADLGMNAFGKLERIVSNWGASDDVAWRLCQTWLPRCLDDCVKADGKEWGKCIQACQDGFWAEVIRFREKGGKWPTYEYKLAPKDVPTLKTIKYLRHRGEQ